MTLLAGSTLTSPTWLERPGCPRWACSKNGVARQAILPLALAAGCDLSVFCEGGDNRRQGPVRLGPDLVVGAEGERVLNEHTTHIRQPQACRLQLGGVDEGSRCEEDARKAVGLEPNDVVHTARRAAPSIGHRLDDEVAFVFDLLVEV
jgi:hypothetical protein